MRRCSHLGRGHPLPKARRPKRSNGSPAAQPLTPLPSVEVETPIIGLPFTVTTMVAAEPLAEPEPVEEQEREPLAEIPSGLVPVAYETPTEPSFGHGLGRQK